jgi:FMN-dependent NADH-azoreductase
MSHRDQSNHFHIHVYFEGYEQREQALALRGELSARFPRAQLGRIHESPVAFHPAPMYQVALEAVEIGTLLTWLHRRRSELSILVHPLLGDVVAEHLEQAIWLGRPLPLDEERLRQAASAKPALGSSREGGPTILRIDSSVRRIGSQGRQLADTLVESLARKRPAAKVVQRDLADGVPLLDSEMLQAWGVSKGERSESDAALAGASETLIAELQQAEAIVISLPIYNFHVPASFKAWIDLVARARETFRYTDNGPVGLLHDRPVYVIITSGGTRLDGPLDFITPWLRHVLGFIGLHDVHVIAADGLMSNAEERLTEATDRIAHLVHAPGTAAAWPRSARGSRALGLLGPKASTCRPGFPSSRRG